MADPFYVGGETSPNTNIGTFQQGGNKNARYQSGAHPGFEPIQVNSPDVPFTNGPGGVGSNYTRPTGSNQLFTYLDPAAFNDPNAAAIYDVINNGINNMSQRSAPMAALTALGNTATYSGANLGPVAGAGAANISPQMMVGAAGVGTGQDLQYAGAQNQLANILAAQAQGLGPSVAEQAARQQAQTNTANFMAALGSQRGASNSGLGLRAAASQYASAQQEAAQQAALGRSQEAMAASQQLGGLLGGARGQAQSMAQTQAGLNQQALLANQGAFNQAALQQAQLSQGAGQFNAQAANQAAMQQAQLMQQAGLSNVGALNQSMLQQGSMNQQTNLANLQSQQAQNQLNSQVYAQMLQALMGQNQTDISNQVAAQQLLAQEQEAIMSLNYGQGIASQNNQLGLMGAGLSAMGGLAAMSDERLKKNIRSGEHSLREFLDAIGGER